MHPLVDAETLARHLDESSEERRWIVFDCRHDLTVVAAGEALYRASHIPGARFASVDGDLSGPKDGRSGRHPLPTRAAFVTFLATAGVNADSMVVGYDASSGLYAARLWWMTRWVGHANVAVLDGGLPAWLAAGLPTTAGIPTPGRGDIALGAPQVATVETVDVEANLATRAKLVIDARAPERWRGEVEPLDPVAGHIPGAVNHPMARNIAADGRFRSPGDLHEAFTATLAGRPASEVVQSCGSGITACHGLLAMEIAGLPGGALYAGSWSAWCADPARPVETGG